MAEAMDVMTNKIPKYFFAFILFFLTISEIRADGKKALKLLEKGEYEKAHETLVKSLEKDSINAGAKYVFSLLYLTPNYQGYNIDTAYFFINEAIEDFAVHDEKTKENLAKININDSTLLKQKRKVEEQAFKRAKALHTIDDYNYFLKKYDGALQVDSAVYYRNEIAYNDAVRLNTWEAFEYFIHKYPDAVQIEEAKAKYEELLYFTKTKDGRLASYVNFLKFFPKTPYRDDAEKHIFELSTADNDIDSYMTFMERYPKSKMRRRALDMLYHCYKQFHSPEGFINRFNILHEGDSLLLIARAESGSLIPVFEMDKYGFIKLNGEKLIDFTYDAIKRDYYCGHIAGDYLEVELGGKKMIVSRLGGKIYEGPYDSAEDMGCGALKIEHDGYFGVYHKSGFQILDFKYEETGLVANAFIKYKYNGKWGLKTFANLDVLPPVHDDIFSEGRFVIIEDNDLFAVQNVRNLAKAADGLKPQLDFKYDDYDLIYPEQLLVFREDKEAVLDLDLKEKLPLDAQTFYEFYGGWLVKKNNKYHIYDQIFYPLSDLEFDNVDYNKSRAALKYQGKWGLYRADGPFPETFEYDSVRFLTEQIGVIIKKDTIFALFDNDSIIDISYSIETRLLIPGGLDQEEGDKYAQYLLTKSKSGIYSVYNINGHRILHGKFQSVGALGREYLLVEKAGRKGLYHRSSKPALKIRYNAIGNYDNGYVSTLLNGKFGIYNYEKNVFLSAKYQKRLKPFGQYYFIGTRGGKYGLVNLDNEAVTGFDFDEILDWNDTVALVRQEDEWKLYDIGNKRYVYEGISEYKVLYEDGNEKTILITKNSQNGILSSKYGEVIGPTFNDIINLGAEKEPVYFAEKFIFEADIYIVIYYDARGKILRKQVFTEEEEYEKIYCG